MTLFKTGKIRLGGGFHGLQRIQFRHSYNDIISLENLLVAWKEFVCGKRKKKDVQEFGRDLMANIIALQYDLIDNSYVHSAYEAFKINDPKPRDIHKANVRDRLLHHALHRILSPFFSKTFMADSYSCQIGKGTHRALNRFKGFINTVSKNNTQTVWVLKCDIKKFFANIDQTILLEIIAQYIPDKDIIRLISIIVSSFHSGVAGIGLPLGNLTSQLLVNIYMNEFDQYMKHRLKTKYYLRYADDFVILSQSRSYLETMLPLINKFLGDKLKLVMHPNKISIKTISSGVDFLGWVHFPNHRVLRTTTKKRMFNKIRDSAGKPEVIQAYLGLLGHGNAYNLKKEIQDMVDVYKSLTPTPLSARIPIP